MESPSLVVAALRQRNASLAFLSDADAIKIAALDERAQARLAQQVKLRCACGIHLSERSEPFGACARCRRGEKGGRSRTAKRRCSGCERHLMPWNRSDACAVCRRGEKKPSTVTVLCRCGRVPRRSYRALGVCSRCLEAP